MDIKKTLKKEWYILVALVAMFVASFILWNSLPEQVPIHFNFEGVADDYGPKWINALLMPFIAVVLYFFLLLIPKIDPKKKISTQQKPIAAIRIITTLFMIGIYVILMLKSLGKDIDIGTFILVSIGALIIVCGNYMNSVKPNYFIGIRTPWTLENPEVWKKTHRISSRLWIVGGICMIASSFLTSELLFTTIFVGVTIIIAFVPIIYSFILFKKIESHPNTDLK